MSTRSATRGFTLLEMMVVLTIIATAMTMVLPSFNNDTQLRLMAASAVLESDIELAQVMTIARPGEAIVVHFADDGGQYWLARADTPEAPIARADTGEPYLITFGAGRASSAAGVTFTLHDLAGRTLAFDAHGGVADFTTEPSILLEYGEASLRLSVTPSTGSIVETAE